MRLQAHASAASRREPDASAHTLELLSRGLVQHQCGNLELARRSYRKALRRRPNDAEILCLLATIDLQSGQIAAAERVVRQAMRHNPQSASPANLLGKILVQQNKLSDARAEFENALRADAELLDARINLGRVLIALGEPDRAVDLLFEEAAAAPGDPSLATERALACKAAGRYDEAERQLLIALDSRRNPAVGHANLGAFYLERQSLQQAVTHLHEAVELDPRNAAAWQNLAMSHKLLGDLKDALACARNVLSLQPGNADAASLAASVLLAMGDRREARELYEQVLARYPEHPMARAGLAEWLELSGEYAAAVDCMAPLIDKPRPQAGHIVTYARALRRVGRQAEAVDRLEELMAEGIPSTGFDRALSKQLHFTLGHLYDDTGDYGSAWHSFVAANGAHWIDFDMARHAALVDETILSQTAESLRRPSVPVNAPCPVFIIGMPRSGTSLVEQILGSRAEVRPLGESGLIESLTGGRRGRSVPELSATDLRACADAYFRAAGPSTGTQPTHLAEKTPHNFLLLGLIQMLFPAARIVHCCRDPLDNALSCFFQDFRAPALAYTFDLEKLGAYYRQYRRLMRHWKRTLDLPIFDLSYEALVDEPETQTQALFRFLGLQWSADCLTFHRSSRHVRTASHAQVRKPIYRSSVGRSRNYAAFIEPLRRAIGADEPEIAAHSRR